MPLPKGMMLEKDKMRGLVPDSSNGKSDEVYEAYLKKIGVETNPLMQQELAKSSDPRFRVFLERMSSPRRSGYRIQTIAKTCGIDLLEFMDFFSKAAGQIAIATAQLKAMGIVEDMAEDAATKSEYCDRCDGMGWVAAPAGLPIETPGYRIMAEREDGEIIYCRTCPKCRGLSTVRITGDEHSRDRVLEIAGIITRGKGAGVTVVQNFGGASHESAISGALSSMTIDIGAEEITDGE